MISIISDKGKFEYDEGTGRIFVNGILGSSTKYEPVFNGGVKDGDMPRFAGIWLKETNSVLGLKGKVNKLIDDLNNVI